MEESQFNKILRLSKQYNLSTHNIIWIMRNSSSEEELHENIKHKIKLHASTVSNEYRRRSRHK